MASLGLPNEMQAAPACLLTLQWQGTADPNVAGYALYCRATGSTTTNRLDVGMATSTTLCNLTASSTYYFYVVAYDSAQIESGPSNLLPYTAPSISPMRLSQVANGMMNFSFSVAPGAACHVEYTETLNPPVWKVLTSAIGDSNGLVSISDPVVPDHNRFYRAAVP